MDIAAIIFAVAYWVSGIPGVGVVPAAYAEGLFSVVPAGGTFGGTMLASQRFATRGLQVFRRQDAFPRTLP